MIASDTALNLFGWIIFDSVFDRVCESFGKCRFNLELAVGSAAHFFDDAHGCLNEF